MSEWQRFDGNELTAPDSDRVVMVVHRGVTGALIRKLGCYEHHDWVTVSGRVIDRKIVGWVDIPNVPEDW